MIVIIIGALVVVGVVVAIVFVARSKSTATSAPEHRAPDVARPRPEPQAPATTADPFDESLSTVLAPEPAATVEQATPAPSPAPPAAASTKPKVVKKVKKAPAAPAASATDEADLGRFSATPAAKPSKAPAPASPAAFRYPMESGPTPADDQTQPVQADEPPAAPVSAVTAEVVAAFDLGRVVVAPLTDSTDDEREHDGGPDTPGATVTRLEPRVDESLEAPLAELVAELIDAADPEVAEVMARLIDASDPDLVAQLVDADDLAVAEVVAKLVDSADPEVRALVVELADAPDRRQVAEVLRLVDADYANDAVGVALPADIAEKLEELDIESDLELTSRPGEMAQFARLDNSDQLRVIIRVLCGLVAREDLPRSPRMPADPASSAEGRRWPLSRARWPVPPPDDEEIIKRAPLPARRTSTKAS